MLMKVTSNEDEKKALQQVINARTCGDASGESICCDVTKGMSSLLFYIQPWPLAIKRLLNPKKAGIFWPSKSRAGVESTPACFFDLCTDNIYTNQIETVSNDI